MDGKIPLAEYEKYRVDSVHNIDSDMMTLGKYEPTIRADGTKDFSIPGPGAYTVKAGDTTYFSLGTELTFADFIGTSDGKADGNGLHMAYTNGSVEDFASIFAAQYEAMKASGALGEDNNLTQQEFLEQFYRQGEFTHDSSNPFLNFVSSVLDITIIKPVIEACTGEDLITGEDLTDMERGLKVVFAVVDLVTLGGAIAATKFSEMGLKEGLKAFGKTALIDFAGNTAACGVGALGETFDWPVPITMMLSLAAGITVSISGNKLLFKNADGIEIGSKTLSDDDLKIVEQTIEGENYSNLTEVVSAKEAEVYLHFLESGSTEGMTESELKAVQKIEELIKSNKIDYDGILKIRNETVKSDVEVVRKTTEDSVEDVGKSAAEDAGKVVESGLNSPSECNISSKQFGKKLGKHKTDYPDLSMDEYKNLIDDVFKSPDKIIQDVENNEFLYLKGNNLLRVTNNGEFVSLYPGAESSRVLSAIEKGGTIWPK